MTNSISSTIELRQTRLIKAKHIQTLAWSPNGLMLAVGKADGTIQLWDAKNELRHSLKLHKGAIRHLAWSPQGDFLASAGEDKVINIWNAETGVLHINLKKHNYVVSAVAWSPDGKTIATAALNGAVRLWSTNSGKLRRVINMSSGGARHLTWTPDGKVILSVTDGKVISLWNSKTGALIRRIGEEKRYALSIGSDLLDHLNASSLEWPSSFQFYLDSRAPRKSSFDAYFGAYSDKKILYDYYFGTDFGRTRLDLLKPKDQWEELREKYTYSDLESIVNPPKSMPDSLLDKYIEEYGKSVKRQTQLEHLDNIAGSLINDPTTRPTTRPKGLPATTRGEFELRRPVTEMGERNEREGIKHLSVSPDGQLIATGNNDATVKIWDLNSGKLIQTLEGHTASVRKVLWVTDGHLLCSNSSDNKFLIWRTDSWESVREITGNTDLGTNYISLHTSQLTVSELCEESVAVDIWELDPEQLFSLGAITDTIHFASAKVVLVGESNIGKSCLALRLTEDRYEEQGTTHGMRVWTMSPAQLLPNSKDADNSNREVILWDMGGQDEYRLVHQLFLHDTTVALILFDPTRGRAEFDGVEAWNLGLENQLRGRKANKLLVGSKLDHDPEGQDSIDYTRVEKLVHDCELKGYYPTSSKTARGILELRVAISESIDWDSLTRVSRPVLFQRIRDEIERRQKAGEVVLLYSELEESLRQEIPEMFDPKAVSVVIEQLSLQGLIIGTRLASGERVLVLQISEVERYAGSVIVAARNNPRGVPAIEEQMLTSVNPVLPAIKKEVRLHPFQERVVLECVVQLLLEHGICLKHEGLLIFPTLFQSAASSEEVPLAHSVSLYYDFAGAIDNIYSSLVVRLAISGRFGRVRLSEDKVEFEKAGQGVCGIRKIERRSGFAHLDLFFSEAVVTETRDLFTVFIEEHLRKEGVNITEVLEITCSCGFRFQEASLRKRLSEGLADIICPECETRSRISEGAKKVRTEVGQDLLALKTVIDRKKEEALVSVKIAFSAPAREATLSEPIRILHLSDLHLTSDEDPINRLQPLVRDLVDPKEGLGISKLDYLVISGDLTNRATPEEFEQAYQFISAFIKYFNFTAERCIIVPGNHDLSWDVPVYEWKQKRLVNLQALNEGSFVEENKGYLIRTDERYALRFENFSKFHHSLTQREYPLRVEEQCIPLLFEDDGLQFITLNSSTEIDEFFPERSSINTNAVARGLTRAEAQVKKAIQSNRLKKESDVTKIAILHHPITGNEKIVNDAFLIRLRRDDVNVCLHGHVHEERADLIGGYHPTRRVHAVGAGSFGAPSKARPESTPNLYNFLEIDRGKKNIRVHTRQMRKEGSAWVGWAIWPTENSTEYRTYYDIPLAN